MVKQDCVYEFKDARGVLLYVGRTNNFKRRHKEHQESSLWYRFATRYKLHPMASLEASVLVERAFIQCRTPVFNISDSLPIAAAWRQCYLEGIHPITTVADAIRPRPVAYHLRAVSPVGAGVGGQRTRAGPLDIRACRARITLDP